MKLKPSALLFLIIIFPFHLSAQQGSVQIDTIFTKHGDKRIQTITATEGNKKTVTTFSAGGSKQSVQTYIDNKLDGTSQQWFPNGGQREESVYSKGAVLKKKKWFQDGTVEGEENYKLVQKDTLWRSVLDGKYMRNYQSGLLMTSGFYTDGKKSGMWTENYESGEKKSVINCKDNLRNGKASYWSKGGKLTGEYNYAILVKDEKPREVMHGSQSKYFESGNISEKSNYNMGKKEGLFEEWYENGNRKSEIEYKDDIASGKNNRWFQNGKVQQEMFCFLVYDSARKYKMTRYEGKVLVYYDNGNLKKSENYIGGKENGLFTTYFEDGQKQNDVNYKNGFKTGKLSGWFRNGSLQLTENYTVITENDTMKSVQDGEATRFSENGVLVEKGMYKKGKKDGLWQSSFPEGTKAEETNYCNGLKCGKSTSWNKDGSLNHEEMFAVKMVNGVNTSVHEGEDRIYDKKGILVRVRYYNTNSNCYRADEFYEDGTPKAVTWIMLKSENFYSEYGRTMTYFSNGQLQTDGFYFQRRAVGRSKSYYINGNLKSITDADASHGNKTGYEIQWTADGELLTCRKFKNHKDFDEIKDKKFAKDIFDAYMNRPKEEGKLVAGKKEGLWTTWFDNSHKQFEENFKDGKPEGIFTAYYPDGKKMAEAEMRNGLVEGKITAWNSWGIMIEQSSYTEGYRSGPSTTYYDNGNKKEERIYEPGQNWETSHKEWYENGKPKSEVHYRDNKQVGYSADWFENGTLNGEGHWEDGKRNGALKYYYEDGKPRSSELYKDTKKEGEHTTWFKNGKMEQIVTYRNDKREGVFKKWWENGNLRLEAYYKNDEEDSTWTFYKEDGKVERQNFYNKGFRTVIPSGHDCECVDSTKSEISYAPLLTDLSSLDAVRKMSFNFHAPIGDFYDHLFFMNFQSDNSRSGASYCSFDIIAYQQVFLRIPDERGIKLILNPCLNVGGSPSRLSFNLNLKNDDKESMSANLYTRYLSIEFNPRILHQWDKKASVPFFVSDSSDQKTPSKAKKKMVPAVLLFKAQDIDYNERDHLSVNKIKEPCFTTAEIGSSGILLDFKDLVLDLDVVRSPDFDERVPGRYFQYFQNAYEKPNRSKGARQDMIQDEPKENFVGVLVPDAEITLPKEMFPSSIGEVKASGKDFMLAGQYVIGTIRIKASFGEGLNYLVQGKEEKNIFSASFIEEFLKQKGFRNVQTEYDQKASEFVIYFSFNGN